MKKRKKYDPNKVDRLITRESKKPYQLWMKFDAVEVKEKCDKSREEGLKKSNIIFKIYELHDGDLIVPLINKLTIDKYDFFVGIDSYYYHLDDPSKIVDHPLQFNLPTMTWEEFRNGGNPELEGWLGISEEMGNIHKTYRDKGYVLFKSLAYIETEVRFKNLEAYEKFKEHRVLRGKARSDYLKNGVAA